MFFSFRIFPSSFLTRTRKILLRRILEISTIFLKNSTTSSKRSRGRIAREIVIQEKQANYDNRVDETFARRMSLWIKNY